MLVAANIPIKTEFYTTYVHDDDITIVWQLLFVGPECIQKELVGWYCGEPDEKSTAFYSNMPLTGQYID